MADKPNILSAILGMKCPNCRKGNMFINKSIFPMKEMMQMPERCAVCGQKMEIEVGFYYGTGYVSYGLAVAVSIFTFLLWLVTIGVSTEDNRIFWWLGINGVLLVVIQPWLVAAPMRAVTSISIFMPGSIICTISMLAAGRISRNTGPTAATTASTSERSPT